MFVRRNAANHHFNYGRFRQAYPGAQVTLVDDAGPLLGGPRCPPDHRAAWYANWRLGDVVAARCVGCAANLSPLYPALVAKYPRRPCLASTVELWRVAQRSHATLELVRRIA
jgi:hypothetical protein